MVSYFSPIFFLSLSLFSKLHKLEPCENYHQIQVMATSVIYMYTFVLFTFMMECHIITIGCYAILMKRRTTNYKS